MLRYHLNQSVKHKGIISFLYAGHNKIIIFSIHLTEGSAAIIGQTMQTDKKAERDTREKA